MKRKRARKTCQKRYTISKRLASGFDSGLGGGLVRRDGGGERKGAGRGGGGSVEGEENGAW